MDKTKSLITWSDNYLLGDEKIDAEHMQLFTIAQKAHGVHKLEETLQLNALEDIIKELYEYVSYHLRNEEKHMMSIGFPEIADHKQKHKELLDMLNFISLNLSILSIEKVEYELYNFVQKVFVKHIVKEDMKIVRYLKKSG